MDAMIETSANRDLRRGVVWTAIGAGLLLLGVISYASRYSYGGAVEAITGFSAVAVVPLCVGLAFLALWFFGRDRSRR